MGNTEDLIPGVALGPQVGASDPPRVTAQDGPGALDSWLAYTPQQVVMGVTGASPGNPWVMY